MGKILNWVSAHLTWLPVILSFLAAIIAFWQALIAKRYSKTAEHQAESADRSAKAAEESIKIAAESLNIERQKLLEQHINKGIEIMEKNGHLSGYFDSLPISRTEKKELLRTIGQRSLKKWDETKLQELEKSWIN